VNTLHLLRYVLALEVDKSADFRSRDTVEQLTESVGINMTSHEAAAVPVKYAYHVTNLKAGWFSKHPDWQRLQWQLADDPVFDGPIIFGAPCVSFTTTLYRSNNPDVTMYPRYGEIDQDYWRINVPLTSFNDYKIILAHKFEKQVRILLLNNRDAESIPQETLQRMNADRYFRRVVSKDGDVKYYSNDYYDEDTPYFVNLAVCDDVGISPGVVWDKVTRTWDKPGLANKEALRQRLRRWGFEWDTVNYNLTTYKPGSENREELRKRLVESVVRESFF